MQKKNILMFMFSFLCHSSLYDATENVGTQQNWFIGCRLIFLLIWLIFLVNFQFRAPVADKD